MKPAGVLIDNDRLHMNWQLQDQLMYAHKHKPINNVMHNTTIAE